MKWIVLFVIAARCFAEVDAYALRGLLASEAKLYRSPLSAKRLEQKPKEEVIRDKEPPEDILVQQQEFISYTKESRAKEEFEKGPIHIQIPKNTKQQIQIIINSNKEEDDEEEDEDIRVITPSKKTYVPSYKKSQKKLVEAEEEQEIMPKRSAKKAPELSMEQPKEKNFTNNSIETRCKKCNRPRKNF